MVKEEEKSTGEEGKQNEDDHSKQRAEVREQLVKFYKVRNPAKVEQVDAIVKKYEDEGQLDAIPLMLANAMVEEQKMKMRKQLVDFYTKHNPDKVKDVDTILEQYKGRLHEIPIIMAKHHEATKVSAAAAKAEAKKKAAAAAHAKKRAAVRVQLVKFYEARNPDKVKQVDTIMEQYEKQGKLDAIPVMMAHAMAEEKKLAVRKQLVEFYEQVRR
jgi:hypothetical protein